MAAPPLHPAAASGVGQAAVIAAGLAVAVAIAVTGGWLTRRARAGVPGGAGRLARLTAGLARWARSLGRGRDALGERTDPVIAAGLALAAGLAATLVIAYLAGLFTKLGLVISADRPADMFVDGQRLGSFVHVMLNGTLLGSYEVCVAIAVTAGLIIGAASRRWLPLAAMVGSIPVEIEIQKLMKKIVHGTAPAHSLAIGPPGGFFSGGSARTLIVCGLLAYFTGWAGLVRERRGLLWTAAALATFAEGYSRLYLGRHWAVDILGGWLAGGLILASFIFAAQALRPAGQKPHPALIADVPGARHARAAVKPEPAIPAARVPIPDGREPI